MDTALSALFTVAGVRAGDSWVTLEHEMENRDAGTPELPERLVQDSELSSDNTVLKRDTAVASARRTITRDVSPWQEKPIAILLEAPLHGSVNAVDTLVRPLQMPSSRARESPCRCC